MVEFDSVKVKDQLGRPEDQGFFIKRRNETVIIEDNTVEITKKSLGNSWIVGSATNGLVGPNTGTVGGGQQVVGASGRTEVLQAVVNPGKIFRDRFYDNYFEDTGETTADWGDTSNQLAFTNGEIAQSRSIAYNDGTVTKVLITATASSGDTANLTVTATADGTNWESITLGTEHSFSNTGTNLKFKIVASDTVVLNYIRVAYS